jgi:hypothetical protein
MTAATADLVYVAVWHRGGHGYVIDLYPHEVEKHLRRERRRTTASRSAFGAERT